MHFCLCKLARLKKDGRRDIKAFRRCQAERAAGPPPARTSARATAAIKSQLTTSGISSACAWLPQLVVWLARHHQRGGNAAGRLGGAPASPPGDVVSLPGGAAGRPPGDAAGHRGASAAVLPLGARAQTTRDTGVTMEAVGTMGTRSSGSSSSNSSGNSKSPRRLRGAGERRWRRLLVSPIGLLACD